MLPLRDVSARIVVVAVLSCRVPAFYPSVWQLTDSGRLCGHFPLGFARSDGMLLLLLLLLLLAPLPLLVFRPD